MTRTACSQPSQVRGRFEVMYAAFGNDPRCDLLRPLGTRLSAGGCVPMDGKQETSTKGLFAIGDLVRGLNKISVAMGEAAIAATAIPNWPRGVT